MLGITGVGGIPSSVAVVFFFMYKVAIILVAVGECNKSSTLPVSFMVERSCHRYCCHHLAWRQYSLSAGSSRDVDYFGTIVSDLDDALNYGV